MPGKNRRWPSGRRGAQGEVGGLRPEPEGPQWEPADTTFELLDAFTVKASGCSRMQDRLLRVCGQLQAEGLPGGRAWGAVVTLRFGIHARLLLTDLGEIHFENGLDEGEPGEKTLVKPLTHEIWHQCRAFYSSTSGTFALGPDCVVTIPGQA